MIDIEELSCDQIKALYRYIAQNRVVIDSGRRSGKTTTLIAILNWWIEHQMKDGENCVIIGRSLRANKYILDYICKVSKNVNITQYSSRLVIKTNDGRIGYVYVKSSIKEFYSIPFGCIDTYIFHTTLVLGDERYIPSDMCQRTACAYTQFAPVNKLSYPESMKEDLRRIKNQVSKESFNREFGQYLDKNYFN